MQNEEWQPAVEMDPAALADRLTDLAALAELGRKWRFGSLEFCGFHCVSMSLGDGRDVRNELAHRRDFLRVGACRSIRP